MKKLLLAISIFIAFNVTAQVTITQNDMPHAGDSLYRTRANINPFLNYGATGANHVWSFTNLVAAGQDSALYQTVASTNFVYALTYADIFFNPNRANHAKPGVDIPFNNLLPITNPYTFYYRSTSVYKTVGFGVELAGIPVPIIFTDQDEIYSLPLNFGNADSSFSSYNISLPALAYYGYEQSRMNEVDGWGVITTPAGTFDALRVKTTLYGKDTINIDTLSIGFAINRPVTREYKWLSPNLRIPVMQVNTTELFGIEIITDIYFYDLPRSIIVVPPLASVICPGQALSVNYDITGTFNAGGIFIPGNDFTAQLSDGTGDFTNAADIGSVTSTQSGSIACLIPINTPPGTGYRIRVVASNPAFTGSDNGFDLTVGVLPIASATAGGLTEFCEGGSVLLSALADSGYTYQWQLDGMDLNGETGQDHIAVLNGNYTVVVTNACGVTTSSPVAVIVHPLPEHSFPQPSYLICNNSQITITSQNISGQTPLDYQWYLDGNLMPGEINDSITTFLAGNYTLEITNPSNGCNYTASVTLAADSIAAPLINITGNPVFCDGDSVLLDVTSMPGITYQWQLNGANITGAVSTGIAATDSGIYTVVATSANGCTAVSSPGITVTENPAPIPPVISAAGPVVFCDGDSVMLQVIAVLGFNYQWTFNGSAIPGAVFNQFMVNSASGIYSVVVTDMIGCSSDASNPHQVTINPLPAAPVITQSNDTLFASGSGNLQWYLDGSPIPGATGPFYIPAVNGNYTVAVTDSNGCENISIVYPLTNVGLTEGYAPSIIMYPNPSTGIYHLIVPGIAGSSMTLTVHDPAGKEVLNKAVNPGHCILDFSDFAKGVYFLRVNKEAESSGVIKLIKQ